MYSFNVLNEPWIPIELSDGSVEYRGILGVLKNAHKIRRVCAASPLVSYSIQRILIAFLIDAFRPNEISDISELIEEGYFNKSIIDAYVTNCNKDGERFDLFNEKHPFLQSPSDDYSEQDKKTIAAKLFLELPVGNNHTHFWHGLEDSYSFSAVECLQALCTFTAFATYEGRSCFFSINGIPPIYFLYEGKNLFETLAGSMISRSEHQELSLDEPPVIWRSNVKIPVSEKIARVSLLHGLTSMPRRITLIPKETEKGIEISEIYFERGWDYKELSNWTDPHVVYYYDKKKRVSLKARKSREVWRDMGRILDSDTDLRILKVIREKMNIDDVSPFITLHTYGLIGGIKGAIYAVDSWCEDTFPIDIRLMEDVDKLDLLKDSVLLTESIGTTLRSIIKRSVQKLEGKTNSQKDKGRFANLSEQVSALYFASAREFILSEFSVTLSKANSSINNWEVPIKARTGEALRNASKDALNNITKGLGNSAKILQWQALAGKNLGTFITKKLKKGGWLDDR